MDRIKQLFQSKTKNILNVYCTAGYPNMGDTQQVLITLQKSGADIIEIGMPFSDPVADGPTIQKANDKALENGMTISLLFEQLKGIRDHVNVPIILMGYVNPVIQYGIEAFCKSCQEVGVDGLILPDLPMQEYLDEYKALFEQYGLDNIFLISPQTTTKRIREIDDNTSSFIYMVSSASITGGKGGITEDQITYFNRINDMKLSNPRLIGFGISNHDTFTKACEYAHGVIVGSAFIEALSNDNSLESNIENFIRDLKEGREKKTH